MISNLIKVFLAQIAAFVPIIRIPFEARLQRVTSRLWSLNKLFSVKQALTLTSILCVSCARRFFDLHLNTSGLEIVQTNADKRPEPPHGGVVYVMVRCPDGSQSKEVLSKHRWDTSTEAVAPTMQCWDDLAQDGIKGSSARTVTRPRRGWKGFNPL